MQKCSRCQFEKELTAFSKKSRWCKACHKAYRQEHAVEIAARNLQYQRANRDKTRGWNRKHYWKDPEGQRERGRQRYSENGEAIRLKHAEWRKAHPEARRLASQRRHKRVREASGEKLTAEQWLQILEDFKYKCAYCGKSVDKLEKEHRVPLSRGGSHAIYNIVPSCRPCNQQKNVKTADEFAAQSVRITPQSSDNSPV